MTHLTRRARSAVLIVPAVIAILGCARAPDDESAAKANAAAADAELAALMPDAAAFGTDVLHDLERVREVTAEFHDLAAAHAAGYPTRVPRCMENQPAGGMGLHYMHQALLDDQLDVEKPEILVYAPAAEGAPKLVGVEYVVPLDVWTAEEPPRIFDQSLKRSEGLGIWYLHVWAWEPNPNGLFADWNPAVRCDAA